MAEQRGAILVIDDNEDNLVTMADLVSLLGFEVHKAKDGFEATEKLVEYGELHSMIADINLPHGIDGLQLARAVRGAMPHVNVVLCSGLPYDQIEKFPAYRPDYHILEKPVSLEALSQALGIPRH